MKQKHQNYRLKKIKRDLQLRQGQIISIGKGLFESVFLFWNLSPFALDLDMQPHYFPKDLNSHTITHAACMCAHISPPVVIFSWIFYSLYLYFRVWIKTNSYFVLCFQKLAYSFPWLLSSPFIIWAMGHEMKKRKIKKMIEGLESKICEGRKRLIR